VTLISTTPQTHPAIHEAMDRLVNAESTRTPCSPVRDLLGDAAIESAYAVQNLLTERRTARGATIVGRKIGLTSPAVQRQLGVDQPDFGVLFDDMDVSRLQHIPFQRLLQPKIEAEIAFRLSADLDHPDLDLLTVRDAVDTAAAALEIVESRIANWDITIADTIADNASSGLFVVSDTWIALDAFEPRDVSMQLYADGTLSSRGSGSACLGDPLAALLWLARTARQFGQPLRAGQVVLSGALGAMIPVAPAMTVRAELSALGPVTASFSERTQP
jgi:2-keto-4-pentenoate hydratase